ALLAAAAAGCGVLAAWNGLAAVEGSRLLGAAVRTLAPLRALGRARPATPPERRRLGALLAVCLLGCGWVLAGPIPGLALAAAGRAHDGGARGGRPRLRARGRGDPPPAPRGRRSGAAAARRGHGDRGGAAARARRAGRDGAGALHRPAGGRAAAGRGGARRAR